MSSLPQGWHNIPGPSKISLTGPAKMSNSSVPTTIRKKWNSPLSTEIPKSKLPSYKTSNLRLQNPSSGAQIVQNGISTSKPSCPAPSSKLPSSPAKPSVNKEYQAEIAKLKKELTTIKAENLILKVKVRRVDDENDFKSRQIEKLRAELKALQKVEAASNKKNKDSELLLLRRKCLQLEGSLKEKDLALKKLQYEMSKKNDHSKSTSKDLCTENSSKKVGETGNSKLQKSFVKESSSSATLTRVSQSLKLEVMKLRDMIHKLEKENQELQQQVKENGQENRRLKMQLKKENQISSNQIPKPNTQRASNIIKSNVENHVPNHLVKSKISQRTNVPSQKSTTTLKASSNVSLQGRAVHRALPLKNSKQQESCNVAKNSKTASLSQARKVTLQKKQVNEIKTMSNSDLESTFVISKPVIETSNFTTCMGSNSSNTEDHSDPPDAETTLESEVQKMRENIAAKKIQLGWREHQKRCLRRPDNQNEDRALTFIVSCLKHHSLRKDKLNRLTKKRNSSQLVHENESALGQAIQSAKLRIWSKED